MRERVSKEIKDNLQKRALEYSILLDDVSITDLQFSPEFTAAIEQKQVAQ
jgi:prohibitin 2